MIQFYYFIRFKIWVNYASNEMTNQVEWVRIIGQKFENFAIGSTDWTKEERQQCRIGTAAPLKTTDKEVS